jgi:hypothetical protein
VAREETQYYFKCSSCRSFGPLTKDELASMRVNELGSSRCPRCGQAGYLDPTPAARPTSVTTWLAVALVALAGAIAAAFSL